MCSLRTSMHSMLQYVGVTWYSTSIVVYTHSLYRHTLVTMSASKNAKCEETMTVPGSTKESEHCEDEANNQHSVLVGECKPLISYQGAHTVIMARQPDGHEIVVERRPFITTDEDFLQRREQMTESWNMHSSVRQL